MLQDVDAMLAELEAPGFTLNGKTYTGRHLSFEQQVRLVSTMEKLGDAEKRNDYAALQRHMRRIVDQIFPPPKRRWFAPRQPSVADILLELPPEVGAELLLGFLKSQRNAPLGSNGNEKKPNAMGPETNGAGSGTT